MTTPAAILIAKKEALVDTQSHREAWRAALTICLTRSANDVDGDNVSYWQHEIAAFDRTFHALESLAQASAQPVEGQAPRAGEREAFEAWMLKIGEAPEDYGLGEHSHPVIFFIWHTAWQARSRQPEQVSEQAPVDEREAFEDWATKEGFNLSKYGIFGYADQKTCGAWETWQARSRQPEQVSEPVAVDKREVVIPQNPSDKRLGGPHAPECKCKRCEEGRKDAQDRIANMFPVPAEQLFNLGKEVKIGADNQRNHASAKGPVEPGAAHPDEHAMLEAIHGHLQRMIYSAEEFSDGEAVTGYKIKTGALHQIVGLFVSAGKPLVIPTGLPQAHSPHPDPALPADWMMVPTRKMMDAALLARRNVAEDEHPRVVVKLMLQAAFAAAPASQQPLPADWVAVEDRLPEDGVEVLTIYKGKPTIAQHFSNRQCHNDLLGAINCGCGAGWKNRWGCPDSKDITYWCPIPPIKPQGGEDE